MTEPDDMSEDFSPLEREALARVRHLGSGRATARDIDEAKLWGRQSTVHADALARASLFWDRLGAAGENVLKREGRTALPQPGTSGRILTRRAMLGGAVAASAVAYIAVRPPLDLWPSASEMMADYRTAHGEQRNLTVDGGVQVTLNTLTSLNVHAPSAGNAGDIELLAGEAAIATDDASDKILRVTAGDGQVSTRRARFNIRHERQSTCIACLDGELRVERQAATAALQAGQQVLYAAQGLQQPVPVDSAQVSAWQQGLLVFQYAPLRDVVAEVNRYRSGKVMLMNAALGERLVNGRFRVDNIDSIIMMFQQIFEAKLTSLPGGIILLS